MRKTISILFILISIVSFSCRKEEMKPATPETGKLVLNIGLSVSVKEIPRVLKSAESTEDFRIAIFEAGGTQILSYPSVSAMPDTIELQIGNYYVEAHSDNDLPAAFDNPYYFGSSVLFTINSNTHRSIQVTCQLANTIVTVGYSENIRNSFTDYTTLVSSELDSLVFVRDEIRKGYFRTLPLDIRVELWYSLPDGRDTSKTISGQIPDPLPRRQYDILVDGSIDAGMAGFLVLLDSSQVAIEQIEINDGSTPGPVSGIGYGELLFTEIMSNPSALSDTEGEWLEIYNNSAEQINIRDLILGRDDSNRHTISDSIVLEPGDYFILERSVTATEFTGYNYGSDILLPNTGGILYIWNAGTETEPGSLIFSLDYSATGFPELTGQSLSLDPGSLNAADAQTASSWCAATSVYGSGDSGTPGSVNDICQ